MSHYFGFFNSHDVYTAWRAKGRASQPLPGGASEAALLLVAGACIGAVGCGIVAGSHEEKGRQIAMACPHLDAVWAALQGLAPLPTATSRLLLLRKDRLDREAGICLLGALRGAQACENTISVGLTDIPSPL